MNQGVEWAAHCAALLAVLPPDVAVPAATLAEFHDLPAAYLAKALQQLAAAGIVTAVPGRRGGYRLARSAEQITLLDVERSHHVTIVNESFVKKYFEASDPIGRTIRLTRLATLPVPVADPTFEDPVAVLAEGL